MEQIHLLSVDYDDFALKLDVVRWIFGSSCMSKFKRQLKRYVSVCCCGKCVWRVVFNFLEVEAHNKQC